MSKTFLRRPLVASCLILGMGLAATAIAWHQAQVAATASASRAFASQATAVAQGFNKRFASYESMLRTGAALVEFGREVTRREWAQFVERVVSSRDYPGMRALGRAIRVPRQALPGLQARMRSQYPSYQVWPAEGTASDAVPVVASEPYDGSVRAVGFDLSTEPVRRAALETARDTGEATITGKVTLACDTPGQGDDGFVVYAPVFQTGSPRASVEQRQRAIRGYVFGAFRMREAIGPLLGEIPLALDVAVLARPQAGPGELLFDTRALRPTPERERTPMHRIDVPVEIGQTVWTLRFSSRPAFEAATRSALPLVIAGGGGASSLLLAALVFAIARTRDRAEALAGAMTAQLRTTQLAAERNRRFLDAILQAIPQPVYVKDAQHRWVMANEATAQLLRAPTPDIVGLRDEDLLDREAAQAAYAEDDEVLEHGRPLVREVLIRPLRGAPRWGLKSKTAVRMPDGSRYVVGVTVDVTDRHIALEELERNRRFLYDVLDAMPNAVCVKDVSHRWVHVNAAFCRLHGRPREELIGATDFDVHDAAVARSRLEEDRRVLHTGEVLMVEQMQPLADGRAAWMLKSKLRVQLEDGSNGLIVVLTDISALKAAQAQSESARALLDEILDVAPQPVFVKDVQHRWLLVNEAFCQLIGRSKPELIGRTDRDVTARPWAERAFQTDDAALRSDDTLQWEESMHSFDGSDRWIVRTKRGVHLRDGSRYVVGMISDVTDLKNAQEELRRHRDNLQQRVEERTAELRSALAEAERANRAKSEFLANMSHELRTPMHAILSFARLGLQKSTGQPAAEALRHYFQRVEQSGERLLGLLNDLLDLSRAEAGKMQYQFAAHDLAPLILSVVRELASLAAAAEVRVHARVAPGSATASCDPQRIAQVLRNLVSNAIKFTPAGGEVGVHLQASVAGEPAVVRIGVEDTGVGIPEEELERIFEKFVQGTHTRSKAGGTGLGLAICREIATAHGGRVWAERRPGGGARFVLELPQASEAGAGSSATPASARAG
jgi:PAS domain S-box-containing protein